MENKLTFGRLVTGQTVFTGGRFEPRHPQQLLAFETKLGHQWEGDYDKNIPFVLAYKSATRVDPT